MLYPAQQAIVDQLNATYDKHLTLTENHYFLSGEMGVGKTYMGAQLAIDHAQNGTIIIVPDVVSNKWYDVLSEMTKPTNLTLVDHAFCKTSKLDFSPHHITIIPNQFFNRLFNTDKPLDTLIDQWKDESKQHRTTVNDLSQWVDDQHDVKLQRALNVINYQLNAPFLVYDEIHQAQKSKLTCLNSLLHPIGYGLNVGANAEQLNVTLADEYPALFLTGTIFNVDSHALADLLMVTNPKLINYQALNSNEVIKNIAIFLTNIWRYISVSIALDDVQKDTNDDIHQTILPIHAIELSPMEKAFYNLVLAQLHTNQVSDSMTAKRKQRLFASNLIDYPEKQPILNIKKAKRKDTYLRYDQNVILSIPLKNMKLNATKKYQTLLTYLKSHPGESTVIYATDYQLIDQLIYELQHDGYQSATLSKQLKPNEYSHYLNQQLANHKIVVVNPNDITVGVDIHAQFLIWYQLLTDMSSIIQAQRRVYRLSSMKDSTVVFLPYALTYQEDLVNDISNSAKNNAASYGIQDRSELAKKTEILLASINQTLNH